MSVWWLTEAIPIPATALIPLLLFPVLGILPIDDAAAPYANPLVYLFLGGFILALGMQRWRLHRRLALSIVLKVGSSPRRLVLGILLSTAFLSLWVSNTATAMMMIPIGVSVFALAEEESDLTLRRNFGIGIALAVAHGATIGGLGTIIGTPPNALLVGFFRETYGVEIGFGEWMLLGMPVVVIGLVILFALLMRLYPVGSVPLKRGEGYARNELLAMGRFSGPEIAVTAVIILVALLWVAGPLVRRVVPGLSDTGIAVAGALLLFVLPRNRTWSEFLLDWRSVEQLPWGVLLMFGGGLSLAAAVEKSGLADYIGRSLQGLEGLPVLLVVVVVVLTIQLVTEVTSNIATAAAFLPLVISLASALGENPFLLAVPLALAASCAFALPISSAANTIAFGTGLVTVRQMARVGVILNLIFLVLITLVSFVVLPLVFDLVVGEVPPWAAR